MRIGNLSSRLTLFTGQGAVDVEHASGGRFGADPQGVYDRWGEFTQWAARNHGGGEAKPFGMKDLGAPAPRPRQVFAIGVNYPAHAEEGGADVPASLLVFLAPGDELVTQVEGIGELRHRFVSVQA